MALSRKGVRERAALAGANAGMGKRRAVVSGRDMVRVRLVRVSVFRVWARVGITVRGPSSVANGIMRVLPRSSHLFLGVVGIRVA